MDGLTITFLQKQVDPLLFSPLVNLLLIMGR